MEIGLELGDAYNLVDQYIDDLWQSEWTNATTGAFYRQIEPIARFGKR